MEWRTARCINFLKKTYICIQPEASEQEILDFAN